MSMFSRASARGHASPADGLHKWVQIDDCDVYRFDGVLSQLGQVVGGVAAGQESAVDDRVESLHPSFEDFGGASYVGDLAHGQAAVPGQSAVGAAGANQLKSGLGEPRGKFHYASLVVNAQ